MALIEKRSTKHNEVYTYEFLREHNVQEVAHWVAKMVNTRIDDVKVITLSDDVRTSDEGDVTTTLAAPIDEKALAAKLKSCAYDSIDFLGKYRRATIAVSINLKNYRVSVAMRKSHILDECRIEQELELGR